MDLIGQPVKHEAFGSGIVTDLSDGIVTVCFQNSEKRFIYPDAFHHFLTLKNRKTQQYIESQIKDREIAAQEKRQAEQQQQQRKRKEHHDARCPSGYRFIQKGSTVGDLRWGLH